MGICLPGRVYYTLSSWGHDLTEVANCNDSSYTEGPTGTDSSSTTPVDEFETTNAFGLDIHSNVYEWC